MPRLFIIAGIVLVSSMSFGSIWSWDCEWSISNLADSQQTVTKEFQEYEAAIDELEYAGAELENAKQEMEHYQYLYDLCEPSYYDDCEWERMNLNNAIDAYNHAFDEYNSAYDSYEHELETLERALGEFSDHVDEFTTSCLD